MAALTARMYSYPRGKSIDFGSIVFLSAAREDLLHRTQITMQESKDSEGQWKQTILQLEQEWNAALDQKKNNSPIYGTSSLARKRIRHNKNS